MKSSKPIGFTYRSEIDTLNLIFPVLFLNIISLTVCAISLIVTLSVVFLFVVVAVGLCAIFKQKLSLLG